MELEHSPEAYVEGSESLMNGARAQLSLRVEEQLASLETRVSGMSLPSFVPSMLSDDCEGLSSVKLDCAGVDEDDTSEQLFLDRSSLKLRSQAIVGHMEAGGRGGIHGTADDTDAVGDELKALCSLDESPSALIETSALTPRH